MTTHPLVSAAFGLTSLDEPVAPPPSYVLRRDSVRGAVVAEGRDFDRILEAEIELREAGVPTFMYTEPAAGTPHSSTPAAPDASSASMPAPAAHAAVGVEGDVLGGGCARCGTHEGIAHDGGDVLGDDEAGEPCWVCASDSSEPSPSRAKQEK